MAMSDLNIPDPSDAGPSSNAPPARKRARYGNLDWEAHKNEIRKLYLDQDRTLKETMEVMAQTHSFNASEKLYKKKFKEWNWPKNIPVDIAFFMAQKARERREEQNKDTVFIYGGRHFDHKRAEDTISRAKRPRTDQMAIDVSTPPGVGYETPVTVVLSPGNEEIDAEGSDWDTSSDSADSNESFHLSWQGNTGSDFLKMRESALALSKQNKTADAEELLQRALSGLCHVSGITNEDTKKVSYDLANLYAETGREAEAVGVVEKVIRDHVQTLGFRNRETQQIVLQVVELLNAWNKHTEALGLLARARDILNSQKYSRRGSRKDKATRGREPRNNSDHLSDVIRSINETPDPANLEHGLGIARSHVATGDEGAERLLLATIDQCESNPESLAKQNIAARAELIKLYHNLGTVRIHWNRFKDAIATYKRLWALYPWDEDRFECFEFTEVVLQLAANLLKSGLLREARGIFLEAAEKATTVFGNSDERTVWVCITIGIVYQTYASWEDAVEWFESAYAKALASREWGVKDGIIPGIQDCNTVSHNKFTKNHIFACSGFKSVKHHLGLRHQCHKNHEMTSLAYAIAVLMNHSKKWRALDTLWSRLPSRNTEGWKEIYLDDVRRTWKRDYRGKSQRASRWSDLPRSVLAATLSPGTS
ncbi:hypothetical protein NUW58_g1107 [Xylaria curta]|uniref:Uncharacterized protein n=1 Tax=Xylaria curta TaxID=42375 RepID=A0ACC1PPF9_9PEZI|nr:hypothetical protein NUW58_g1107 [Xylaria curta]